MSQTTRNQARNLNVNREGDETEYGVCPRCGSDMVADAQGVKTAYPSPPLEKYACSDENCTYTKYSRADALELSALARPGD
ncbi:MAG: hypothetical protein ACOC88_00195 [Candidatus Bipolaricaulota bacterium]